MKKLCILLIGLLLVSCSQSETKPFGAEEIEYEKVEEINKEGPAIINSHDENVPPTAEKNLLIREIGPESNEETEFIEPTADMDKEPDYGGIPVIKKGND